MMNTRVELAAGLGDSSEYLLWKARADEIRNRLHKKLWQNDLGRFAYFADMGKVGRPAGRNYPHPRPQAKYPPAPIFRLDGGGGWE